MRACNRRVNPGVGDIGPRRILRRQRRLEFPKNPCLLSNSMCFCRSSDPRARLIESTSVASPYPIPPIFPSLSVVTHLVGPPLYCLSQHSTFSKCQISCEKLPQDTVLTIPRRSRERLPSTTDFAQKSAHKAQKDPSRRREQSAYGSHTVTYCLDMWSV